MQTADPMAPPPPQATMPTSDEPNDQAKLGLFEHRARPEWGVAMLIIDSDNNSESYQFEDGKLRKIATSHVHLLKEVHRQHDECERLRRELTAKAGVTLARRCVRDKGDDAITLDLQIRLFLADFDGGFDNPEYVKTHRNNGKRRALRHRDPAIAQAQQLLGGSELSQLTAANRHEMVMARVIELLASTSLVDKRQMAPMKALDDTAVRCAVAALSDLLIGEVAAESAMQGWVDALATTGMGVSWALATAVPALVQPSKHLCVRESTFAYQARSFEPSLRITNVPSGKMYARLRLMALRIVDELATRSQTARDLLDVHDFVWLTLRPAARKRMAAMPPAPVERHSESSSTSAVDKHASDSKTATA